MQQLIAPPVLCGGRWWPASEVAALATSWGDACATAAAAGRPVAAVLPSSHEGIALLMALVAQPVPIVLLPLTPSAWPSASVPPGTALMLPPSVASLAIPGREAGCHPIVLAPGGAAPATAGALVRRTPGLVIFTSGSTGAPKPVLRDVGRLVAGGEARLRAVGVRPQEGLLVGVSLASAQGATQAACAIASGRPIGLLAPLDHRAALAALARPEFGFWWATPHFADVLGRCALTSAPVAPRACVISSPISQAVFDAFRNRFGVALRQVYSSTETGPVCAEGAPDGEVTHGCVGTPVDGVEVVLGDSPDVPVPAGEVGRVWVRSPYTLLGYGIPPDVTPFDEVAGWVGTRDLARFDERGRMWLAGRVDHNVRTRDGRLVNLSAVEAMLRDLPDVREAVVVPMVEHAGTALGAIVEVAPDRVARAASLPLGGLPEWARPRVVAPTAHLPRLANGKVDRRACADLLLSGSPA